MAALEDLTAAIDRNTIAMEMFTSIVEAAVAVGISNRDESPPTVQAPSTPTETPEEPVRRRRGRPRKEETTASAVAETVAPDTNGAVDLDDVQFEDATAPVENDDVDDAVVEEANLDDLLKELELA